MKTLTKELQATITPAMVLDLLRKGNERYVNNLKITGIYGSRPSKPRVGSIPSRLS